MKRLLPALAALLLAFPAHASSSLYVSSTGNVGIGTTAPADTLDVLGSTTSTTGRLSSSSTDSTDLFLNNTSTGGQNWYVGSVGSSNPGGESVGDFHIGLPGVGSWFLIDTAGDVAMPGNLSVTGNLTVTGTATLSGIAYPTSATSGGIPYFSSTSAEASSGLLTQYAVVIGGGAGTAPTVVSGLGTAGQVLTSNGGSAAPTFQNASGSSGALTLLDTVNASGASSVTFGSSYITGTYNKYVIEFDSVIPATADTQMELQVSSNNGSTWQTSGYSWQATFASAAALNVAHGTSTAAADGSPSASAIGITGTNTAQTLTIAPGPVVAMTNVDLMMASTSNNFASGTIRFSSPSGSGITNCVYDVDYPAYNGGTLYFARGSGSGEYLTAGSINAIRILMSSGNITGNFHLYGLSGT
jgi:hypothetical protein